MGGRSHLKTIMSDHAEKKRRAIKRGVFVSSLYPLQGHNSAVGLVLFFEAERAKFLIKLRYAAALRQFC